MFLHWPHKALFTFYLYIILYIFFEKDKENKNEIE